MSEPGLDRQQWETEWAALEPLLEDSPVEALSELDDLVDDEGIDPEVLTSFRAAREITWIVDRGDDFDPGDVASAINLYREIYEGLLNREVDLS